MPGERTYRLRPQSGHVPGLDIGKHTVPAATQLPTGYWSTLSRLDRKWTPHLQKDFLAFEGRQMDVDKAIRSILEAANYGDVYMCLAEDSTATCTVDFGEKIPGEYFLEAPGGDHQPR